MRHEVGALGEAYDFTISLSPPSVLRLSAPRSAKAAGTLLVACAWCAPRPCKWPDSVPAAQQTATDRAGEQPSKIL
jgi:hypothetical protein